MPDGILPALGRFKPGTVNTYGGEGTLDELNIALITNLAGEPIRFSFNEDLGNLVSTANLLILNANISELGETTSGVYSSDVDSSIVEEDESLWGTLYAGASVEPNQLVSVTEIIGDFTSSVVDGITVYTPGNNSDTCTTYWRVVTFTVYEDENGVPYCDIQMESLVSIVLEKTIKDVIDAQVLTDEEESSSEVQKEFIVFIDKAFMDGKRLNYSNIADEDGYAYAPETTALAGPGGIMEVSSPDEWMEPLILAITSQTTTVEGGSISFSMSLSGIDSTPCIKVYHSGDELWKCIDDILSFNRIVARFKRDFTLVQWTLDDEGWGDTVSIGEYGTGIKATYTKDGVYNSVITKGFLGVADPSTGLWKPTDTVEATIPCSSSLANNVLNGSKRQMPELVIPADYLLKTTDQIKNWGEKELYKSFLQARGISVESNSMPLSLEVGMSITGSSRLFGTVSLLVTTFSRTTDAQAKTCVTNLGGRALGISGPDSSWI